MTTMSGVIVPESDKFSHREAMQVYETALAGTKSDWIIIDLSRAHDATCAAFARLVLLRRALRECGRDLFIANLHDRAAEVYRLNKLACVLPEASVLAN